MEIKPDGGGPVLTMQCAGGTADRAADGNELPLHHWLWMPAGNEGFAVAQKGAFACDCLKNRLRLTLIRSSLYGYEAGREVLETDPQTDTDMGVRQFKILLLPDQKLDAGYFDRASEILNEPFTVIRES